MTLVGKTIKDGDVISIVRKFLVSGIMIDDEYEDSVIGTPQGGLCEALHNPPYAKKNIMQSNSHKTNKIVIHGNVTLHNLLFKSQF